MTLQLHKNIQKYMDVIFVSSSGMIVGSCTSQIQREALHKHHEAERINKDVFQMCFSTISPWLDLNILCPRLLRYGIIMTHDDIELLTSPYHKPLQERKELLMKIVELFGQYGFSLLYICLKESMIESRGHEDAVTELEKHGITLGTDKG